MLGIGWPYRTDQVGMKGLHLYNPFLISLGCRAALEGNLVLNKVVSSAEAVPKEGWQWRLSS